ncbi:dihydropyrimidinase related protein-2 (M38 family) [Schistosoma mansoni]|uniref:dihydropyrimidinase n=3 Tax=Schistosoma mansoni TaxID=6183 RepID=G4VES1_SCHMA|nr:dihydropyrimidinase related protein-2 (M38 family) [Schistosoma mansoni]|eukprot:XP_018651041.1 dihydropyrimidinase related protein-2 (M38 family) [Schistosoma mansoni]
MNDSRVQVGVKKLPMHLQSSQNRLLIKGGKVVNDDRMFTADIYIEDGVIRQVGSQLSIPGGVRIIEASGRMVIPGGVDPHTCFDSSCFGLNTSDDFYSGTRAALAGGTTTIINCIVPTKSSLLDMYEKSRQAADSKACCDYSMHFILFQYDSKISKEMELLVKEKGVNSFRVFLSNTNDMLVDDGDFFEIAKRCKDLGAVLQVHAENGKLVKILESKIYNDGITGPEGYLYSHPEMAEIEATHRAISLADAAGCPLYILQVTSPKAADQISEARWNGNVVVGETLAAALGADGTHYKDSCWRHSAGYVLSPPLRVNPNTPDKLMRYVSTGVLECTASGHCTFKTEQKAVGKDDFRKIPSGVNGVEDRMSVVWERGVMSGFIDPCKFVAVTSTNAAKVFNLYPHKGRIDVGSDADLVIWDGDATRTISAKNNHENVDFNIFEGLQCHGVPVVVVSAGRVVLEDGELRVTQGAGRFVPALPFSPYIFERTKRLALMRSIKPVIRDSYTGPISTEFTGPMKDAIINNGTEKASVGSDAEGLRPRSPTRSGGRNMQESSFSLSGAQYDDSRPIRTGIRTKQPPGGASNALW